MCHPTRVEITQEVFVNLRVADWSMAVALPFQNVDEFANAQMQRLN